MLPHLYRRIRKGDWAGVGQLLGGAVVAVLDRTRRLLSADAGLEDRLRQLAVGSARTDYITPRNIKLELVLFSPLYGTAWWTPAFFVGLIGSIWFAIRRPSPGIAMLAAVVIYVLYNASILRWWAGGSFGMRRFSALAPMFAVGLASLLYALRRWPALVVAIAGALSGWGVIMTVRYVNYRSARSRCTWTVAATRTPAQPAQYVDRSLTAVMRGSWLGSYLFSPNFANSLLLVCMMALLAAWVVGYSCGCGADRNVLAAVPSYRQAHDKTIADQTYGCSSSCQHGQLTIHTRQRTCLAFTVLALRAIGRRIA